MILTASVSDGTLCHLGSDSGKVFLEDHEDIKSQFLGFCLKRKFYHSVLTRGKKPSKRILEVTRLKVKVTGVIAKITKLQFLCPRIDRSGHIVFGLSVCPSVNPSVTKL